MSIHDDLENKKDELFEISNRLDKAINKLSSIDDDTERSDIYEIIESVKDILSSVNNDLY